MSSTDNADEQTAGGAHSPLDDYRPVAPATDCDATVALSDEFRAEGLPPVFAYLVSLPDARGENADKVFHVEVVPGESECAAWCECVAWSNRGWCQHARDAVTYHINEAENR